MYNSLKHNNLNIFIKSQSQGYLWNLNFFWTVFGLIYIFWELNPHHFQYGVDIKNFLGQDLHILLVSFASPDQYLSSYKFMFCISL